MMEKQMLLIKYDFPLQKPVKSINFFFLFKIYANYMGVLISLYKILNFYDRNVKIYHKVHEE